MKLTKPLIFTLGVTFGAFVTIAKLYYDALSKQPQPSVVDDEPEDIPVIRGRVAKDWIDFPDYPAIYVDCLDDTQPIHVVDKSGGWIPPGTPYIVGDDNEVGVWDLDKWAKEAE